MSLTQRKTGSNGPLRPILGQRLKPGGLGGSARRALTSLGSSNRRENLRLAESLLTISASEFRSKWNFDPLTETPLSQGQFLWKPTKPLTPKVPLVSKSNTGGDLAACFKLPQREIVTRLNDENSTCKVKIDSVQTADDRLKPVKQTFIASKISELPVSQACGEQICQSVKDASCSELKIQSNATVKRKLCEHEENNNILHLDVSPKNQLQSTITDFLRICKKSKSEPMASKVLQDNSKEDNAAESKLPSVKLRKIKYDGNHS